MKSATCITAEYTSASSMPYPPLGLWKLIRHRVFNLPEWIVDRQTGYSGVDPGELGAIIGERGNSVK